MKIITIPCLFDNYAYLLIDDERREAAVVDPAEAWPVLRETQSRDLTLTLAFCTHHHRDHVGGIEDLLDEYPDLRVAGFQGDRQRIEHLTELFDDGAMVSVCGRDGLVMHTPGHTASSIVYRFDDHLFVGDTLFGAGCGRLFEGTAEEMITSLARIVSCGPQAQLYFGHEYTMQNLRFAEQIEPENPHIAERLRAVGALRAAGRPSAPSTVDEELKTNPFLRVKEPTVIETLAEKHGLTDRSALSVFKSLRRLRNDFS